CRRRFQLCRDCQACVVNYHGLRDGTARGAWRLPCQKEYLVSSGKEGESISEERRKEIFLALVDAQDQELSVGQSRKEIAEKFNISESQIRDIEREGIDQQWPPL